MEVKEDGKTTQIQISIELANKLKLLMKVGDTYEIVIRRLYDSRKVIK